MFFFVKQKTAYEMRISDWSSDVCSSDLEVARAGAERKNIEFVLELSPSVGVVIGDRSRLHQALEHILKNAVAYTEGGGRVLLKADGNTVEAEITISDNGRGIKIGRAHV